jgi:hypothetical protein
MDGSPTGAAHAYVSAFLEVGFILEGVEKTWKLVCLVNSLRSLSSMRSLQGGDDGPCFALGNLP